METKHTPGPWVAEEVGVSSLGPDGVPVYEVATSDGHARIAEHLTEGDAKFIVRACNTHEQLVAALKEMVDLAAPNIYPQPDKPDSAWAKLVRARDVLAAAGAA